MKFAYFFGRTGRCLEARSIEDESHLEELKTRMGAATFAVCDRQISLDRAKLIDGVVSDVPPAVTPDEQTRAVRAERDLRLIASDWVMLSDVPMDASLRDQWLTYRQALRDITNQPDIFNIVWPTRPE